LLDDLVLGDGNGLGWGNRRPGFTDRLDLPLADARKPAGPDPGGESPGGQQGQRCESDFGS